MERCWVRDANLKICILSSFEDSMQKGSGYSARTYNLARSLAESGNDVSVVLPKDKPFLQSVEGVKVYGVKGLFPRPMLEVLSKVAGISRPTSIYFYDFFFAFRVSKLIRENGCCSDRAAGVGSTFCSVHQEGSEETCRARLSRCFSSFASETDWNF